MSPPAGSAKTRRLAEILILSGVAGFLYARCFILPGLPIYQGYNAPIFLEEAVRILHGQVIYRDFFEFTFPGTQLLYAALLGTFGVRAWVAALIVPIVGTALVWLGIAVSRRVLTGPAVFLPAVAYATFAVGDAIDATHHWFSLLGSMAALAVVLERRTSARVAIAGALLGLATGFTQSRGVAVAFALGIFLFWEARDSKLPWRWLLGRAGLLTAGFVAGVFPFFAYSIWKAGAARFFSCTFTFPARYYHFFSRNNLGVYMIDVPEYSGLLQLPAIAIWLFQHLLVPLIYLLFFARYVRRRKEEPAEPWDRLMLVNLVGLALFGSIAFAPNWFKVVTSTLPGLILFVWFIRTNRRVHRAVRAALWVWVLGAGIAEIGLTQFGGFTEFRTPVGRVAVTDDERAEKYEWLFAHPSSQNSVYEADDADFYFILGNPNPTEISFVTPSDYTRPEQARNVLAAIERRQIRYILWSPWLDVYEPEARAGDHLRDLRRFLAAKFRVVKSFSDGDEMWERKEGQRSRAAVQPAQTRTRSGW